MQEKHKNRTLPAANNKKCIWNYPNLHIQSKYRWMVISVLVLEDNITAQPKLSSGYNAKSACSGTIKCVQTTKTCVEILVIFYEKWNIVLYYTIKNNLKFTNIFLLYFTEKVFFHDREKGIFRYKMKNFIIFLENKESNGDERKQRRNSVSCGKLILNVYKNLHVAA